ncbi:hypothetical protein [Nonomuraea fuscirosea]|uniref:hypothetical protein n=1 Tax=Nonomuraea fuscirosea TaxID=1291556 RepID=UPI003427D81C
MTHEAQWPLLAARGLGDLFAGIWIEGDPADVARLMGADPAAGVACGFGEAMRSYEPYAFKELLWIGEHSPGWTHAITIAGPPPRTDLPAAGGRRFVRVVWDRHGIGVHDLSYSDGTTAGELSPRDIATPWALDEYAAGLLPSRPGLIDFHTTGPAEPVGSLGLWLENWLVVAGRLSGRFMDARYLDATRLLCRVPL